MEYPMEPLAFMAQQEMTPRHFLDGDARACLWRIRMILARHDKLDRFGVHILDDEFELADTESLVEYTYTAERKLVTIPMATAEVPATVETMWRFDIDVAGLCYQRCARSCVTWGSGHSSNHQYAGHMG